MMSAGVNRVLTVLTAKLTATAVLAVLAVLGMRWWKKRRGFMRIQTDILAM